MERAQVSRTPVWASSFVGKTRGGRNTLWRPFCGGTAINNRHVAWQVRGTVLSRGRPPPTPTPACSRTLPLASVPVVTEHTRLSIAGFGIFPLSGTPQKKGQALFVDCWICSTRPARKKNNHLVFRPNFSPRFVFSGVSRFRAFLRILLCILSCIFC